MERSLCRRPRLLVSRAKCHKCDRTVGGYRNADRAGDGLERIHRHQFTPKPNFLSYGHSLIMIKALKTITMRTFEMRCEELNYGMKTWGYAGLIFLSFWFTAASAHADNTEYVDPAIGTRNGGN